MADLDQALSLLRAGQLVAIPTETVYGLAADATQPEAVARVFALKGRPSDHPLIMHFGSASQIAHYAELPEHFWALAERFWPGPLTLILPKRESVHASVTGQQDTVAVRVPAHPKTLELLGRLGRPLVAPSANRFGHTSPTCAEHVREEFGQSLFVLDGGPCQVGLESTILDLSGPQPRILRPGQLSREAIEEVVGPLSLGQQGAPRVPGALERHYAPRTPTHWFDASQPLPQGRWGWLGFSPQPAALERRMPVVSQDYARELYAALRELDGKNLEQILVEPLPPESEWEAIRDRLNRATTEAGL